MVSSSHAVTSHARTTTAAPAAVWAHFAAVADWKHWNAGVIDCSLDGPFAVGSALTMVMPDGTVITSELVEVETGRRFTDETRLGETVVRVSHDIAPLPAGGCTVTYTVEVSGDDATEFCAGISSDFPDVLAALAASAERQVLP